MFTITRVRGQNLHGHSFSCNSSTAQCSAKSSIRFILEQYITVFSEVHAAQHSVQPRVARYITVVSPVQHPFQPRAALFSYEQQSTAQWSGQPRVAQHSTVFSQEQHSPPHWSARSIASVSAKSSIAQCSAKRSTVQP